MLKFSNLGGQKAGAPCGKLLILVGDRRFARNSPSKAVPRSSPDTGIHNAVIINSDKSSLNLLSIIISVPVDNSSV